MKFPLNRFVFAVAGGCAFAILATADTPAMKSPRAAEQFPLTNVRLLDGPFRDAMLRDQKYLLSLDPDRLLRNFRVNVGLPTEAKPYGGWESPTTELRGHSLGHYLSALSLMYASTGDEQFKQRADHIVAELALCQSNSPAAGFHEGYLSAFPESFIDRVEQSKQVWAPWYTLHKILAGLVDANQLCGNTQALTVAEKMADWVQFRVNGISDEQFQRSLNNEQGGMNEALANLSALSGNTNYLALAEKFCHRAVLDPLARGEDRLNGLHANTQIPKTIGAARIYELTGDPHFAAIAENFWNNVALHRSFVFGGNSDNEHFYPTNSFEQHLTARDAETCNTYNMLKLTTHLFAWRQDAARMDFYERALFNDILASQDPDTGMMTYFMSLKPGGFKTFSTPEDAFWCCVGTGMENHARYGEAIYYHGDNSLFVNLFIASELSWPEKNIILRQETKFPDAGTTSLKFQCQQPAQLALKIRWPAWADQISVRVNGKKQKISGQPSSYVTVDREWRNGDRVDVELPMKLRTEPLPGTTNIVALLDGPIVLAGDLGTNGMPANTRSSDASRFVRTPAPSVPVLVANNLKSLLREVHPTRQPLVFRTSGLGETNDVTLVPFYQANHERYNVYWTVLNKAEWKAKSANTDTAH
jgi:DUF1680 family protein